MSDTAVWSKERRPLTVGLLMAITMLAFEALGVATAMPETARDLDGLSLYGWAFSASTLAALVGISIAGPQADRLGPARPFAAGLVLFAAGLTIAGLAPSMPVVVLGRLVQGLGIGLVPPVIYASIGRAYGDAGRARMFALLSTAWVLPGLIGPAIAGAVAETIGWRWVFLGLLPLVPLNAFLTLPALSRLPAVSDASEVVGGRVPHAIRLAVGAGIVVSGLGNRSWVAIPLILAGGLLAVPALHRLLPEGSLRAAAGLPAAVATRGMQTFAFFGAEAFLPLTITRVRGQSSVVGGLTLTVAALTWTAGAWVQDRVGARAGRGTLVRRGLVLVTAGVAGLMLVLLPAVPVWVAGVSWAVAGFGMGLAFGGISLIALALAPKGREGSAASAVALTDVLGVALSTGAGGALVAAGEAFGWSPRAGVGGAFLLATAGGCLGLLATRRIPRHVPTAATEPSVPAQG